MHENKIKNKGLVRVRAMLSNEEYKQLHEQFVSNLNGTTIFDVSSVFSIAPLCVLTRQFIALMVLRSSNKSLWFIPDVLTLILPVYLISTAFSENHLFLYIVLLSICIGIIIVFHPLFGSLSELFPQNEKIKERQHVPFTVAFQASLQTELPFRRNFISTFRSYMLIATGIVILAVDFHILPRRYAKSESFGTGLMDVGVGGFVIANAILSQEARGRSEKISFLKSLKKSTKSSLPLIILGALRCLSTKGLDYQEHVTEYGVHWNFFFTLVAVKILSTAVFGLFSAKLSGVLGVLILCFYQTCLKYGGLGSYLDLGSDGKGGRHNIIEANREGIISTIGMLALYLCGVQLGMFLFSKRKAYCMLSSLISQCFFVGVILYFVQEYVQNVSRRSCNAAYVLWVIFISYHLLASFHLVECTVVAMKLNLPFKSAGDDKIFLLEAINNHGLFFFLFANLLTGLVNLTMRTMFISNFEAHQILLVYLTILTAVVYGLEAVGIKTKFW